MAGTILTAASLGVLGAWRAATTARMGAHGFSWTTVHSGQMVGCPHSGLAILLVSLGFNLIGEGLRDVFYT